MLSEIHLQVLSLQALQSFRKCLLIVITVPLLGRPEPPFERPLLLVGVQSTQNDTGEYLSSVTHL